MKKMIMKKMIIEINNPRNSGRERACRNILPCTVKFHPSNVIISSSAIVASLSVAIAWASQSIKGSPGLQMREVVPASAVRVCISRAGWPNVCSTVPVNAHSTNVAVIPALNAPIPVVMRVKPST